MKRHPIMPLTAAIASLLTTPVFAQSQFALEEVVVTAQKREQSLQDVPIAVTAMNAEALKQAGVSDVSGIALRTPGFSMGEFNPTQPQLFIRGIGSNGDGAGGGEQSVAMFVDGVYINRASGSATELYDLAGIEVLRGPQGTLWGKNAIAGAVNVTTLKPTEELTSSFELGAGTHDLRSYRGLVSGPLNDNLRGKLSFSKKERDGYVQSVIDPSVETGNLDSEGVRSQLLFTPSDSVEMLLTLDYSTDQRTGAAVAPDEGDGLLGLFVPSPAFPQAGFHENYMEEGGKSEVDAKGISLQVDWDNRLGTLTSLTAYRDTATDLNNITLGTGIRSFPVLTIDNYADEASQMFSQELRLSGEADSLNWQAGVYYNRETTERIEGGAFTTAINLNTFFSGGGIAPLGFVATLPDDVTDQENTTTSIAAFGQATYSLTEALDITFGLRYTREEKDFASRAVSGSGLFVLSPYDIESKETWNAPTYKLVLNYFASDAVMVYASAASGFKSGGYDGVASNAQGAATPFDEEQAFNLELGFKSTLADGRLRLNGALFNTDYQDLQILQAFPNGGPIAALQTRNAGEARSRGLELEATLAATANLQFSATYAYLDTEYTKLDGSLQPYEGNQLRNAPRNAYSLAAIYDRSLSIGGSITARAEYIAKDQAYQDVQNIDVGSIPAYRIANFRFAYTSPNENWEVASWVNNAFDEEYLLHNYQMLPFGSMHVPAMGRTVGMTVTWNL